MASHERMDTRTEINIHKGSLFIQFYIVGIGRATIGDMAMNIFAWYLSEMGILKLDRYIKEEVI